MANVETLEGTYTVVFYQYTNEYVYIIFWMNSFKCIFLLFCSFLFFSFLYVCMCVCVEIVVHYVWRSAGNEELDENAWCQLLEDMQKTRENVFGLVSAVQINDIFISTLLSNSGIQQKKKKKERKKGKKEKGKSKEKKEKNTFKE